MWSCGLWSLTLVCLAGKVSIVNTWYLLHKRMTLLNVSSSEVGWPRLDTRAPTKAALYAVTPLLSWTGERKYNERLLGWGKDREITQQLPLQAKWTLLGCQQWHWESKGKSFRNPDTTSQNSLAKPILVQVESMTNLHFVTVVSTWDISVLRGSTEHDLSMSKMYHSILPAGRKILKGLSCG